MKLMGEEGNDIDEHWVVLMAGQSNMLGAARQSDIDIEELQISPQNLQENVSFLQIRSISNYVEERNKDNWDIPIAIKNLNSTLIDIFEALNS